MFIALCGASGTGKTTLAKKIAEKDNIPYLQTSIRECAYRLGFENIQDIKKAPKATQELFQSNCFYETVYKERLLENFISDRSLFCIVGYMFLYDLNKEFINKFASKLTSFSTRYDYVFYTPITTSVIKDEFRIINEADNRKVDDAVRSLLSLAKCKVVYLDNNRDDWYNQVMQYIKK